MSWTEDEMFSAKLVHGPERFLSDTYRLHIEGTLDDPGKVLDVPGWMVGDPEMVQEKVKAAEVIRRRLAEQYSGQKELL